MMENNRYDAIVIGSGISGGWAAKELTEKGLKTLMLERGRNVEHVKDYSFATQKIWEYPHRNTRSQQMLKEHPIQARTWPMTEGNADFLVNEVDNPYVEAKPFDWIRGYQVGGRSLIWGRQSYRMNKLDFEANARDGIAVDWPIRYKDLEPWYSYVERYAGISGNCDGIAVLPDGEFLPPMALNVVERDVAARIKAYYRSERQLIIGRTANITQPHHGRINCQYQNQCAVGCNFGGYFSTQSSTLPAAVKTGNLTVRPWSIVMNIRYDKDRKRACGVTVLDTETNQTYEFFAKVIFLNASALNSTWILMNSATDIWENGLGSSSGELGHNVMDHTLGNGARGIADGYDDKYTYGRRPTGIYIPRFRNLNDSGKQVFLRGYGYQGGAGRQGWMSQIKEMSIGAAFKDGLCEPGAWTMSLGGFGEILPYHENRVYIDRKVKDKWGLPVLAMDAEIKENERIMIDDIVEQAQEMLEVAGIKEVKPYKNAFAMGGGIHEMGTARMGRDPGTSVLNSFNQVWDAPNVFVTDGAAMTSAGCVNPSLTYMAMTARAVHYAVEQLKQGYL